MIYGGAPFSATFNPQELFYYYDHSTDLLLYLGLQHGWKKFETRNAAVWFKQGFKGHGKFKGILKWFSRHGKVIKINKNVNRLWIFVVIIYLSISALL